MEISFLGRLRRMALTNLLFAAILFGWVALLPKGEDGSARIWPLVLSGYTILCASVYLLRKPRVRAVYPLKIVLSGLVICGSVMTLVLIAGIADGTSGLQCWRATLLNGC